MSKHEPVLTLVTGLIIALQMVSKSNDPFDYVPAPATGTSGWLLDRDDCSSALCALSTVFDVNPMRVMIGGWFGYVNISLARGEPVKGTLAPCPSGPSQRLIPA